MKLRVVILGSGTSVPNADRRPPAFLLQTEASTLLIDCGAGASTALAAAGVTLDQLSGILLSHFHLDHTAELAPLLFALRNPAGPQRTQNLPILGPKGVSAQLRALRRAYGAWVRPRGFRVEARRLRDRQRVVVGPVQIKAYAVAHTSTSLAFRFKVGSKRICYSGDTAPCVGLLRAARDADLLLCECGASEGDTQTTHMRPSDVGRLAAEAGCKRVVLTHLYREVVVQDPVAQVKRHYSGEVVLGCDNMQFIAQ